MNRSNTPSRVARTERLGNASPYARPEPKIKRSTSLISFPGIRSLVSYITHPFARSPTSKGLPMTNGDIDVDQKSESGSEDGWNGEPGQQMEQADVFHLAAAAGRDGPGFEKRAESWRAGEKPGGRRDTARKHLQITANGVEPPLISPVMPGHLAASPAVPIFGATAPPEIGYSAPSISNAVSTITSSLKRRLSPTKEGRPLPPRAPIPSFTPATPSLPIQARTPHATSASSAALKAFLDARNGEPLTPEDLRVIESLTERARQETEAGPSTQATPKTEVGGWAAGKFTPRPIKGLPSTPGRGTGSAFGTPVTPGFSMGISPPRTNGTPGRFDSPGSVRYIGPGWSAKRMYPQTKSHLKPLFKFNLGDEGVAKKRKVEEFESGANEDIPPVPPLPSSISMPNIASSSSRIAISKPAENGTPLPKPSPKADPVSVGKRRAADIMLDLINAEMAETAHKEPPPPFIVNPYHPDAQTLVSAGKPPATPTAATPSRNGTPRKSILKLSTSSQTPLRGAAKRLEEAKHAAPTPKKLTALEMLASRPAENDSRAQTKESRWKGKGKAVDRSEMVTEDESSEVEDLFDGSASPAEDIEMATPPKKVRIAEPAEEPAPFKPCPAPQLSGTPIPLPSSQAPPSSSAPTSSFTFTPSSNATSSGLKPAAPTPKFTPSPLSKSIMPDEPKFELGTSSSSPALGKGSVKDLSSIYLSAKDTALSIAKEALPFFTFFTGLPQSEPDSEDTKRAKEDALKRPLAGFAFTLELSPSALTFQAPALAKPAQAAGGGSTWTCDLCGLQNPATALTECTICDTPRPAPPALKIAPTAPAAAGPWTCDMCMLQNPATALEKCTVCDEDRPGSISAKAPAAAPSAPGPANKGFDWAAARGENKSAEKKPEGGLWRCAECMLHPERAHPGCKMCEALRL